MAKQRWFEVIPSYALSAGYIAMLVSSGTGLYIGLADTFWPVSLSSQLVGVSYLIAGIVAAYGLWRILPHAASFLGQQEPEGGTSPQAITPGQVTRDLTFVSLAAIAGLYIDGTIVGYSFHHKPFEAAVFAVLACICLYFAVVTLPIVWNSFGGVIKTVGISIAALVTVSQFWYQSVYVPQSVPIGMNFTVTLGHVNQSGSHRLVELDLTAADAGAVPALDLGSMVVIRGLTAAELRSGTVNERILKVLPLSKLGGFFFPDDTISDQILIRITDPRIQALSVNLQVYFARTSWLALASEEPGVEVCPPPDTGPEFCAGRPGGILECVQACGNPHKRVMTVANPLTCPRFVQFKFSVLESTLRMFTQGDHAVYSHWHCAGWQDQDPNIGAWISPNISPAASDLGIIRSTRNEVLLLPKDGSKF